MLVKTQRLEQLKAKLKGQGYGFSDGLKQSFTTGDAPTFPSNLGSTNIDQDHLEPIINNIRPTLRHRSLRTPKQWQQTVDPDSQVSLIEHVHQPDTASILEKLGPLLSRVQQHTSIHDSQISSQDRPAIFQELLSLSVDEVKVACDHIDFDVWTDSLLADLCDALHGMANLTYPIACTLIQASIYSHVSKSKSSLSRLLMNSILQLGTSSGNAILNALILPLLGTRHTDQTQLGQPQLELISKLISGSLNVSCRTTFLRFLLSQSDDVVSNDAPSDTTLQLMNTLATSNNPFISMDGTMVQQLIQASHQVIQARPKDKTCMQLLLTLTSKHTQALVDANRLDDLEVVATQSQMFLKRSVLGQLATIRKKTAHDTPLI